MKDDNIQILGKLKKEKSSKPLVVITVFILLVGTCFGLPYIRSHFGDDIDIKQLLNPIEKNDDKTTLPINPDLNDKVEEELPPIENNKTLECSLENLKYNYEFNTENKLSKIEIYFEYLQNDIESYRQTYQKYYNLINQLNALGAKSTINETDNMFIFETTIENQEDYSAFNLNIYNFENDKNYINIDMTNKGYDCK